MTKAIEALGTGFLRHPGNDHLRDQLAAGQITSADLQRSLLRTVYRLLFWFVAEDRDALLDPAADDTARARYTDYYSSARLRRIARRRVGTRHTDLWQAARIVLDGLGREDGRPELGLAGLGGLFEPSPLDVTDTADLPNDATLTVIRLLVHHPGEGRRPAAGRRLPQPRRRGARLHLRGPARAAPPHRPGRAHVHPRNSRWQRAQDHRLLLHPQLPDRTAARHRPAAPGRRGRRRRRPARPALLALTVCDPACGSGHFLVAAARRIAKALAQARYHETEPTPTQLQAAIRDVVGRCIHGVDLNPMAAELAKVSLWLEALEPGKPLAFLDAHIRVGNALLGTTPALLAQGIPDEAYTALTGDDKPVVTALRKRNKTEREQLATGHEQLDMFEATGLPVDNTRLAWHANALRQSWPPDSLS